MIVLGIDPGLNNTGIVALKTTSRAVVYRGTVRTPKDDEDLARGDFIVASVTQVLHEVRPSIVLVEGYEYQGPRTHQPNSLRISMLVGRIYQAAKSWALEEHIGGDTGHVQARVFVVTRTEWGKALGITTDASQRRRLSRLGGLELRNEHERDAGSIAEFGAGLVGLRR